MSIVDKSPEQLREEEIVRKTVDTIRDELLGLAVCDAYHHARNKFLKVIDRVAKTLQRSCND